VSGSTATLNGGLLSAILTGGTLGCRLNFIKAFVDTQTSSGFGGMIHCTGTGPALLNLDGSKFMTITSNLDGGLFYLNMTDTITLQGKANTHIDTTTSKTGSGGVAYLSSLGNVFAEFVGSSSKISTSTANKNGGGFYLDGQGINTLNI
jgi:hypothetical protein